MKVKEIVDFLLEKYPLELASSFDHGKVGLQFGSMSKEVKKVMICLDGTTDVIDEALEYVKQYDTNDVFVIGGASIYEQMLPYCDVAHVTVMDYAYQADTWFPNLDKMDEFVVAADSEEKTYFDLEYCFKMYVRKSKLKEVIDFTE